MAPPVGSSRPAPHTSESVKSRLKVQSKTSGDDWLKKLLVREVEAEMSLFTILSLGDNLTGYPSGIFLYADRPTDLSDVCETF